MEYMFSFLGMIFNKYQSGQESGGCKLRNAVVFCPWKSNKNMGHRGRLISGAKVLPVAVPKFNYVP